MSEPENPSKFPDSKVVSKRRHVRVTQDQDGQRVDNFLIRECLGVPRSHLYRLIRTGDVLVDGRRIKQTRKLVAGEQVRIPALEMDVRSEVRDEPVYTDTYTEPVNMDMYTEPVYMDTYTEPVYTDM